MSTMSSNQHKKNTIKPGLNKAGILVFIILPFLLSACGTTDGFPASHVQQLAKTETATAFPAATQTQVETLSAQRTAISETTRDSCSEYKGQLLSTSYESAVLSEDLEVRIYLPPCYNDSEMEYPAAYFFHGSPPSSADWVTLGVIEKMNAGIASGEFPPAILVFPLQPDSIFIWSDGGPDSYEEEFFLGLVPFIENSYRVVSLGSARAIAGISRGGVWALEISMMHPDDFTAAAALSPALQYNDPRPQYDPFNILETMERTPKRILLQAGEQDWARNETEDLAAALEGVGKPVNLAIIPGSHESSLWSGSMDQVLLFLFEDWLSPAF